MTPQEVVYAFTQLAARCLDSLIAEYDGSERPTVWTGLFLRPRDGGEPVRSGTLSGLGEFKLHGRGCAFELDSGEDLDVDWDDAGHAVFDSWKLLVFAQSIGWEQVGREDLRLAASVAVDILQLADDAFTWPDRRYDLVRGDA